MHAKNVLNIGPAVSQPLATGNKVTTLRPLWISLHQAFANYSKLLVINLQLEGQCASIFIPKISFQFQPAKFEIFQTELLFQIRKLSELH